MFQNFGRLAQIRGYAPNNCEYKVGGEENVKILYRDGKTGEVVLKDSGTRNYNTAKNRDASQLYKNKEESTQEIWMINTD